MSLMLLPPKEGTCPVCATVHQPEQAHNWGSRYYQFRFYGLRGRWPTWADAIAHLQPDIRERWKQVLIAKGHWDEPAEGEPIADPVAESL